jgi:TRAP transporter TAXI family solute receptor
VLGRIARSIRLFFDSSRAVPALALGFLLAAVVFLYLAFDRERLSMRISAGDPRGRRSEVARALATECARRGLDIEVVAAAGSEQSLAQVERGELDAALVQGGLRPGPDVREIAPLTLEPLHLLIRGDADIYDIEDLRGARVNLSPPHSGTRRLALEVLALANLDPGRDFEETSLSYQELEELDRDALPDAIFHVSALPSPVAHFLVESRGYRLLPMADAVALRDVAVSRGVIPAYTYGASPAVPAEDVPTLATRMVIVAHRRTPEESVRRILEAIDSEDFGRLARVPHEQQALFAQPEMPLHAGTVAWLHRNDPVLTSEGIQGVESLRSFLVSLIVAAFFGHRWWRRKRLHGLDTYLAAVSEIDREVLEHERDARLDVARLLALRQRLGEVKTSALESFAKGQIHSEELLSSFLTHVSDVRSHLNAMILHERERREKTARARGGNEEESLRQMWSEALAEEHDDRVVVPPRKPGAKKR